MSPPLFYFYKKHRHDKGRLKAGNYTKKVSRIGYSATLQPKQSFTIETSKPSIDNPTNAYLLSHKDFAISNYFIKNTGKCRRYLLNPYRCISFRCFTAHRYLYISLGNSNCTIGLGYICNNSPRTR